MPTPLPPQTQTEDVPVFDAARLNRNTHGDPVLQIEVLALFVAEVERLMQQLENSIEPTLRAERLRAIMALARNTGAMRLAQEARRMEAGVADGADIAPLRAAVDETVAYVRRVGI